jgi:hypothetical protein
MSQQGAVMDWLDLHAGATQALAAIASVLVTLVLAVLTARYVRLTSAIAKAGADQVRHMESASLASRRENAIALAVLAERLRPPLVGLDASIPSHEQLFKYAQLTPSDIITLESLARTVGGHAVTIASEAAVGLRTIYGVIEQAHRITLVTGWRLPDTDAARYYEARQAALTKLDDLARFCREVAP